MKCERKSFANLPIRPARLGAHRHTRGVSHEAPVVPTSAVTCHVSTGDSYRHVSTRRHLLAIPSRARALARYARRAPAHARARAREASPARCRRAARAMRVPGCSPVRRGHAASPSSPASPGSFGGPSPRSSSDDLCGLEQTMTSSLALLPPATHPFWRSADVAEQARREVAQRAPRGGCVGAWEFCAAALGGYALTRRARGPANLAHRCLLRALGWRRSALRRWKA